ncbi:hypothetical protein I6A84_36445 [Frankia sp. CNm7]|uniref:Uncharacterized protein n=1 Tax=Frankia nepalensis TaxID=1836974 RepID=A0A937RQA2_9ACTN|nr:hypothetical protein [Frankia nepalensis]MBL7496079.1 hypothetical protein [Frankia nepalensis]MBL7511132.1 hypothetical protein [Frankia nepalensis]MBL7523402.1 hypothetical protein [Frankia nepalensis]MBL7630683.1 hypothetical protein [Frankia nepalensis]
MSASPTVLPLLVLYRRATGLDTESDPRANIVRIDDRWLVPPERSLGFGRAVAGVDIPVRLTFEDGESDPSLPRLAGRVTVLGGRWALTNCATRNTKLFLTAPGLYREITRESPPEVLVRDWQLVTLRSRGGNVEHRFHLVIRWRRPAAGGDGAPSVHWGTGDWEAGAPSTSTADPPAWTDGDRRTLAAYCYPELNGLLPRPRERRAQTLLILGRPANQPNLKWLDKQLKRLKKDAGERLGADLAGEAGTPPFIEYVVAHHPLLADSLRELDAPVTARLPPPARGAAPRRAGDSGETQETVKLPRPGPLLQPRLKPGG